MQQLLHREETKERWKSLNQTIKVYGKDETTLETTGPDQVE